MTKMIRDNQIWYSQEYVDQLQELHRIQLAAISTISICNTLESLNENIIQKDNPYWTQAYDDVVNSIAREIVLIEKNKGMQK